MSAILRRVDWVQVAGKWTRVSVMGTDLSDDLVSLPNKGEKDDRTVILMIPGNPGNEGFYAHFGREILANLLARDREEKRDRRQYLFYTVSSLNHVHLPNELSRSGHHTAADLFSLDQQVQHKFDFVREHLPRGKEIFMLGHSIGSYMMLKILPQVINEGFNVSKAIALFPTIQHMAISPNGKRLQRALATLNNYDCVTRGLTFWLDFVPVNVKKWLVGFNLKDERTPTEIVDAATELLHMNVFRNIVHMSNDELDQVVELDETLLKDGHLLHFYYGLKDGWCPVEHGHSMRERHIEEHVTLDEDDCEHAFVITEGDVMAKNVLKYF